MQAFSLILFGATGDLAKLKIIPAIYELKKRNLLPKNFSLIGNGRTQYSHQEFREYVIKILENKLNSSFDINMVNEILENTYYVAGDLQNPKLYTQLSDFLQKLLDQGVECGNRVFHLAILPDLYKDVSEQLGEHKLSQSDCGWVRVLLEKPFGKDLDSAKELDSCLKNYFSEEQIFRIDHYLAKETVQNILTFRYANELFEPTLNNTYVDHIQITMLEEFGIKDRGKFYERTGAVRDVLQNHLLQLLATVTMNKPKELTSKYIREERQRVLTHLKCPKDKEVVKNVVSGQYQKYTQEKHVDKDSRVETFVALKAEIDNPRWSGVPIYIRSGKALCQTVTEINIVYKDSLLKPSPNVLTFGMKPHESIVLRFFVTKPGPTEELQPANLQFHYHQLEEELMDAYQRVLLDSFKGNQTLFTMAEGVESEWKFVDPILDYWDKHQTKPEIYQNGSCGPKSADQLIQRDNRGWITPSTNIEISR